MNVHENWCEMEDNGEVNMELNADIENMEDLEDWDTFVQQINQEEHMENDSCFNDNTRTMVLEAPDWSTFVNELE